jgi:hypothetical protein
VNRSTAAKESWILEGFLCVLIGLPWYFFSASIVGGVIVHALLVAVYLVLVVKVFGRGSAVMSFLLVFILSSLVGMAAVVMNDGRLFREADGENQRVRPE